MNVKEWAEKLNNKEYGWEINNNEMLNAKADGVIIAYGASDDLLEFRGAIYDEFSCFEGGECRITKDLKIFNEDENREEFTYNKKEIDTMKIVKAIWAPEDKHGNICSSWLITTDFPHETFDLLEDGELYCKGIVFDKKYITGDIA